MIGVCKWCGGGFETTGSRRRKLYCSDKCVNALKNEQRRSSVKTWRANNPVDYKRFKDAVLDGLKNYEIKERFSWIGLQRISKMAAEIRRGEA